MKRFLPLVFALCILLVGCTPASTPAAKQYTATFMNLFDTVTTIKGFATTEEEFAQISQAIHDDLKVYHELFDIYNDYEGINNIKTINDQAGIAPVTVEKPIIDLLTDCKAYYDLTGGKVNAAMGSILRLWHDARTDGVRDPADAYLPAVSTLQQAAMHIDFDHVIIDKTLSTVYIADPETSLDLGAIAKGWATQKVAENAPEGMLISVGGNVYATGPKDQDGTPWVIGIQSPDSNDYVHSIYLRSGAVVTSGDYQRTYSVGGKKYHHIIDPDTQMPSAYWRSVTVVCSDSGLADALSTALFLLPLEEGMALAKECEAEVLWIDATGAEFMTPGFQEFIRT